MKGMVISMSTYYEYRDVKVMIAHKLMNMDGWKVYGYSPDRSDSMTDYYDPAHWGGVAEKNGYILCVDVYGASEPKEIREYNYDGFTYDRTIAEKIEKLKQMTVERGASEQEEQSAKSMILRLQKKAEENSENANKYVVTDIIPGHMANPPRMNWHIEKDGVYVAKGNGILKFAHIDSYYNYPHYKEDMEKFKTTDREKYKADLISEYMRRYNDSEERAINSAESHIETMESDLELVNQFEAFINKIDTTCGGLLGEGDGTIYEKVKVTEYKKENKAVEDATGSIKDGQCFIVKTSFNYGHNKGYVYRIHATKYEDGKVLYHAYKLNGKLTKECTGTSNSGNYWFITDNFIRWFEKGSLAWCHIEEVKTPYEVEKVVKKTIKAEKKNTTTTEATETATEETNVNNYTYEVTEDTDTRTNEKIYLVKVAEKLSREEYITVNKYIKSLGGYYSKFKHAFLFKENPTDKLNATTTETTQEPTEEKQTETTQETTTETEKEAISYTITEDQHTQTGAKIWIVKPEKELNKTDFAEVKRKLATIQGYYSTFKHGFIFKYNPTEALQTG